MDPADLPVARDTTGKRENWAKHGFPESREIRESPVDQATRACKDMLDFPARRAHKDHKVYPVCLV